MHTNFVSNDIGTNKAATLTPDTRMRVDVHRHRAWRRSAIVAMTVAMFGTACSGGPVSDTASSGAATTSAPTGATRADPMSPTAIAPAQTVDPTIEGQAVETIPEIVIPAGQPFDPPAPNSGGGVDIVPEGTSPPAHPCDSLEADGSALLVSPDPLVLEDGVYDGSIAIVNCSDGDVDWTAATVPGVELDDDGANILPGEMAELDVRIASDSWEPGAVEFKVKVSEPGHNHYVDVYGFRQLTGRDMIADVGLSAGGSGESGPGLSGGEGAGGCANDCIVSALLRRNLQSPNLALDITLDTPARVMVWVSTNAPVDNEGVPEFAGVWPIEETLEMVTEWTADLSPLEPATDYHIVVAAIDEHGNRSYESGEFRTVTPVEGPGELIIPGDAPGCAAGCIQSAKLTPSDHYSIQNIAITSHTAARYELTLVPQGGGDVIWIPGPQEYSTEWSTRIDGLAPATTYSITLQAIDENHHTDVRSGEFVTDDEPAYDLQVTLIGARIDDDADSDSAGEMFFGWTGDDNNFLSVERSVNTGEWIDLVGQLGTHVADDVRPGDRFPILFVAGYERDPSKIEICEGGGDPTSDGITECGMTWSVAGTGITTLGAMLDQAVDCSALGRDDRAGEACFLISTGEKGTDYPEFTAVLAIKLTPA